ncbi:branched-subunit amino acid transport protein [Psychromicrobium silvestre]|uniref:Branched-subunit amino acid transport protein n=1 Tax=Psychromicrobium silvestre TaxID=1645614 RepID=A0A7Y9LTA3_9MICC|nr:AzlD domain-containing protein [Psychromicrobium silvestre]NYE95187.1 branched-subunit amino acid transport protein [Psychromicrobium silvestre]
MTALVVAAVILGIGTFAFRFGGTVLRRRVKISVRAERVMTVAVVVLFSALVMTSALIEGHGFAGFARPAGVLVAGFLAWRKAPFVLVVLAAALTAAGLRLLGVP